jgi:DNA-binding response OmpR family regulator
VRVPVPVTCHLETLQSPPMKVPMLQLYVTIEQTTLRWGEKMRRDEPEMTNLAAIGPSDPKRSPRATILAVDDDAGAAGTLRDLLEFAGYQVLMASRGSEAKQLLEEFNPDLVILDIVLPDVDGLVLVSELRAIADVPIIMVSGTTRKRDATLALRLGADDFVWKPYDIYDLEARIEAVLRRARQQHESAAMPVHEEGPQQYVVGELVVDRMRRHVTLGGKELQLTPTEYRLLTTLVSRPGDVFSRDELAQKVWGYQDASSGRAIDVHIRRLRVKLDSGAVPPPPIISVRGFGYKIAPNEQPEFSVA